MKKFFYVLNILVLLSLTGLLIYNEYYRVEPTQTADSNVSEYTITVGTNAGTVVDYVDYDVISADEYAIETVGFNRQFCELSILRDDVQLENGSAIEVGDELTINIAVPEGYKLNAFYVGGYFATSGIEFIVTGNTTIYIDIERVGIRLDAQLMCAEYDRGDICITVCSDSSTTQYNLKDYLWGAISIYVYIGDILNIDFNINQGCSLSGFDINSVDTISDIVDNSYSYNVMSANRLVFTFDISA